MQLYPFHIEMKYNLPLVNMRITEMKITLSVYIILSEESL